MTHRDEIADLDHAAHMTDLERFKRLRAATHHMEPPEPARPLLARLWWPTVAVVCVGVAAAMWRAL